MKKRLQHIFKRHKAGIPLTDEEHQLLFLPRSDNLREDIFDIDIDNVEPLNEINKSGTTNSVTTPTVLGKRNQDSLQNNAPDIDNTGSEIITSSFTISQLLGTGNPNTNTAPTKSSEISSSESFGATESTLALPTTSDQKSSIGLNLLQQFQQLKSFGGAIAPPKLIQETSGKWYTS